MSCPVRRFRCHQCGKWSYSSRKEAKQAMRSFHPGTKGLGAYRCHINHDMWHIGHSYRRARKWVA